MRNKKVNKKIIKIILLIVVIIFVGLMIWFLYLYPRMHFRENERKMSAAGERYYEINSMRLPSEEGRIISVNLSTLIKQDYLDGLYEAYGNKLCDLNNSNVKAIYKDGEFSYYTYLKCGSFESDVDHEGPEIKINGSTTMTINKGETYNEPGVKSVVDNVDGKISADKVTIKGNVDTSTVGTYEVTYTAKDSLDNETTITRTINVKESLSSLVKENTENGYYVGNVNDNYILFSNMLFRIVKVNKDNSVVIVSDDALANVDYSNSGRFENSSLDKWLNDYFYNLLEPQYQDLIKSSSWCDETLTNDDATSKKECGRESVKRKIGLLSIQDYNLSYDGMTSYLDKPNLSWYSNLAEDNKAWAITSVAAYPDSLVTIEKDSLLNVVPALTLKADTAILSGDGTVTSPYVIIDSTKARRGSDLSEGQIGEYVEYSGYIFRISNVLNDGTVEAIMNSTLKSDNMQINIGYTNNNKQKVYNPNQDGNIGYKIKNEMTKYIDTSLFVKKKISVPIYDKKITYIGEHSTKKYNLLVTIPSAFDIFSAKSNVSDDTGYWLIDSSKSDNIKNIVRSSGTLTYTSASDEMTAGVKLKVYFDKDVVIASGSGTFEDPYTVIS